MPRLNDPTSGIERNRRWLLLSMILLPIAGCAAPWSGMGDPSPLASTPQRTTDLHPRPAAFRQVAFRQHDEMIEDISGLSTGGGDAVPIPANMDQPLVDDVTLPHLAEAEFQQQIDLASALGMAGGNAWSIQLARQRTVEAHSNVDRARALWLPSLQFGVGWNKHDGRIQATNGQIIEAGRNSLFVGGGATMGDAPLAGGSGGPLRLTADLALTDAYFEPQIARRRLDAQRWGVSVAKNQALLQAGTAYVDLVESAGQVADSQAAISAAEELLQLTRTFAEAGAGAQADVDRAATERARLQQRLLDAQRLYRLRSANLSRRLRMDPRLMLHPADQFVVPVELTSGPTDIETAIGMALSSRPEISEQSHRIAALCLEVTKENVAPWIPNVTMTTSAGMFGGGTGTELTNQASRSDVDLQALWELDSMGMGVAASRQNAGSRLAQQRIQLADLRDEVTMEVVQAFENVLNYRIQIETAEAAMALAEASYQRNLQRVRADEGLPIELLQAINARAEGLRARTTAVAAYNRAQLELLYVTGQLAD